MSILTVFLLIIVLPWLIAILFMRGEPLGDFDQDDDPDAVTSFPGPDSPGAEYTKIVESIRTFGKDAGQLSKKEQIVFMRRFMEDMSEGREYDGEFVPVDAAGVPSEWVLAPGADPAKRVLYIHGGAYMAGSSRSHRNITHCFSEMTGAAVLAIDYRLMPENSRRDGIADCRSAYRWILENGPDGASAPSQLVVSGDSAGGNMTLSLIAWARDKGLRAADAAVAFSPTVDGTFSSPSIRKNVSSDIMLGPMFGPVLKIPQVIRAWLYLFEFRFNPANPVVSPIFGDLSNLPPTLIQASEAEMLLDDARRYVRKARANGSHAVAQSWPQMLHVWQIFYPELPQARQAMQEVLHFLQGLE